MRVGSGSSTSSPHDIEPAMAKKKHLSKASGTPAFAFMNHGGKRQGAGRKAKRHADGSRVEPSHQRRPRFTKSRPLRVTLEVNEERSETAALGMPRPDPLSTAAWFPYWAERELLVAPTQIPASVVRPAQCFLMKLAFEGAPLSFAAPMRSASGTSRHRSAARAGTAVERGQEPGTTPNRVARRRGECRAAAT
jgi:hypothetical protein